MPSTNGHGPKRAILYARVSTDEQPAVATRSPSRWNLLGIMQPAKGTRC